MDKSDEQQLVELLKKLEPGFLPYDIFVQIARLVVMPIIEFVPIRTNNDQTEVLLLDRSVDDPIWPGEVHVPGTVVRATDTEGEIYKAFERIIKEELQGVDLSDAHFVGNILHQSKRGMEHAQVFWVEVQGDPVVGEFYPAAELPENLIKSQKEFIAEAVKHFERQKG